MVKEAEVNVGKLSREYAESQVDSDLPRVKEHSVTNEIDLM